MNSKTPVTQGFHNFSPEPRHHVASLAHLYADYAELLTILEHTEPFSQADLVKRFMDHNIEIPQLSQEVAGPAYSDELSSGEKDDRYDSWSQQVFSQLESRATLFHDHYPFEMTTGSVRLRSHLTIQQKLYIMLLLCSNLPYFQSFESTLTTEFEGVAFEALKSFLPPNAVVRRLGKNSDYGGNAKTKICTLAREMNVKVDEFEVRKIQGNQERGLDVVAWVPFSDRCFSFVAILAQCACGKNWINKLSETRRFDSSYFYFQKLRPIHAIFVPRGLNYKDDLYQSDELSDALLFERGRILTSLSSADFFHEYASKRIVDDLLEYDTDIV